MLYPLFHSSQWTPNGPNRALYKNEKFDALLDAARKVTETSLRKRLYSNAEKMLVDEAPWIFIDHQIQVMVVKANVRGFRPHPNFDTRLTNVYRQ